MLDASPEHLPRADHRNHAGARARRWAVTVQAAATPGDERGATLTSLEVVTTPGATANVNRAIQTLPGAQAVDEGTALFVRGGDYTETKVLLDGAPILNSTQLRTPTGTFTGTVDPFLLDGIFFSSGGFSARYVADGYLVYAAAGALWGTRFDANRLETRGSPVKVLPRVTVGGLGGAAIYGVVRPKPVAAGAGAGSAAA